MPFFSFSWRQQIIHRLRGLLQGQTGISAEDKSYIVQRNEVGEEAMNNRVDKLKRRMEAKRRKRRPVPHRQIARERSSGGPILPYSWKHEEEREDTLYTFEGKYKDVSSQKKNEPFFRKDRFIMQILASICLFFVIGILFQSQSSSLEGMRNYVQTSFSEDFQFSTVAGWYEEAFGRPVALLPPQMEVVAPGDYEQERDPADIYALPASGTIRESFEQNGRGIYVETNRGEKVEAVRSGIVRFIGEDEANEWGNVIVIRHYDGGESWYGRLENIPVQLYDHVDSGDFIGEVSPHQEEENLGVYYFALKEGDTFIDPNEVINFD